MDGGTITSLALGALGIFSLAWGLYLRRTRIPGFFRKDGTSGFQYLILPFGAPAMIALCLSGMLVLEDDPGNRPPFNVILAPVFLAGFASALVVLYPVFFRVPFLVVPSWYRRALRSGIPPSDKAMLAAFKGLPVEEQRRRAAEQR